MLVNGFATSGRPRWLRFLFFLIVLERRRPELRELAGAELLLSLFFVLHRERDISNIIIRSRY